MSSHLINLQGVQNYLVESFIECLSTNHNLDRCVEFERLLVLANDGYHSKAE